MHRLLVPYCARGYGKCDTPISINVIHVLEANDREKMKRSRDSSQMDLKAFFKDSTLQSNKVHHQSRRAQARLAVARREVTRLPASPRSHDHAYTVLTKVKIAWATSLDGRIAMAYLGVP